MMMTTNSNFFVAASLDMFRLGAVTAGMKMDPSGNLFLTKRTLDGRLGVTEGDICFVSVYCSSPPTPINTNFENAVVSQCYVTSPSVC